MAKKQKKPPVRFFYARNGLYRHEHFFQPGEIFMVTSDEEPGSSWVRVSADSVNPRKCRMLPPAVRVRPPIGTARQVREKNRLGGPADGVETLGEGVDPEVLDAARRIEAATMSEAQDEMNQEEAEKLARAGADTSEAPRSAASRRGSQE